MAEACSLGSCLGGSDWPRAPSICVMPPKACPKLSKGRASMVKYQFRWKCQVAPSVIPAEAGIHLILAEMAARLCRHDTSVAPYDLPTNWLHSHGLREIDSQPRECYNRHIPAWPTIADPLTAGN